MRSAQALWDAAAPLISITEQHPFLVAMVDGTLPLENFRYYVVQDALYLADFATALRLVAGHDGISAEESKRLNSFADGAEEAELCLHTGFFKEWGILDDATNGSAEQMPHTLLYTSYMLRVAATRPHAEGLAVLLPCFWVYMHVGQCMQKLRNDLGDSVQRPPEFDAWIDMYGGDDFERDVRDYIALVDNAACGAATNNTDDDVTWHAMQRHFLKSCQLEHMFWNQALTRLEWPAVLGNRPSTVQSLRHSESSLS